MTLLLQIPPTKRRPVTPLRYPGGKHKLTELLFRAITAMNTTDVTYVEPFAGGAGAGLALLDAGDVSTIVINDLDPAVHAFWHSAVHRNDELCALVESVDVTQHTWLEQREVYRSRTEDTLALGFATLFLNRTSRSGVLGAGIIGGKAQAGRYRADARFYRETLISRLSRVGELAARIDVRNMDGLDLIAELGTAPGHFLYVDPPYYVKGASLYLNSLEHADHLKLAEALNAVASGVWLLTYDVADAIANAYPQRRQALISLQYSAHNPRVARELLVMSDSVVVPGLIRAPGGA
jgi:DNA adenine methylase